MIVTFGGINEEVIHPLQRRFQLLRRRQLAIRHQIERDQGIIQNRRELMQVFMSFRARHLKLRLAYIKGRLCLVIIEGEQQVVGHGWQFAFATTAWLAPSRSGRDLYVIWYLLGGLV